MTIGNFDTFVVKVTGACALRRSMLLINSRNITIFLTIFLVERYDGKGAKIVFL